MRNYFYSHVYHTTSLLFASIFDEMEVWDYDADGKATGRIPVPVKLTYKEKVISMILKGNTINPNVMRDNENVLPMISIQWTNTALDTERMRGMREKRHVYLEYANNGSGRPQQKQHMDMQTVPYKLTFEVNLWAKYMDHLVQLAENIDTFIHPEMYLEYYEKGIGIGRKIKVTKVAEKMNLNPDIPDNELRSKFMTWSYTFEVECNLYKPELPVGSPIKRIVIRHSAVTSKNGIDGIDTGEQTVTQTVDTATPGTSGISGCFYDYDADIVAYIRKFSDTEQSQIASQYVPLVNCQLSPQDIVPPAVTPVPILAYGEVPLSAGVDTVTVSSPLIQDIPEYVPSVNINAKSSMPTFAVEGIYNVQPGSFVVKFTSAPVDNSFSLMWNAVQKYNSNESDV
jgi:hypothetical protein